jgi:hypothetical protein
MADPIVLVAKGGDAEQPVAFACSGCKIIHYVREYAEKCCDRGNCVRCGVKLGCTLGERCEGCRRFHDHQQDLERYAAAPTMTLAEYRTEHPNGMFTDGDRHWSAEDDELPDVDIEFVWCCDPLDGFTLNAEHILESALEEHHEDAMEDVAVDELQKLLDDWSATQKVTSWLESQRRLAPEDVERLRNNRAATEARWEAARRQRELEDEALFKETP